MKRVSGAAAQRTQPQGIEAECFMKVIDEMAALRAVQRDILDDEAVGEAAFMQCVKYRPGAEERIKAISCDVVDWRENIVQSVPSCPEDAPVVSEEVVD